MRNRIFIKVYMMLLAALVSVACGSNSGNKESEKEAETVAESVSNGQQAGRKAAKSERKSARKAARKKRSLFTPTSAGSPFEMLVVAGDDAYHSGAIDTLYAILTDDVPGLSQSEPCFKVTRINKKDLSNTLRLCRNIIIVKIDPSMYSKCGMNFSKNVYAEPQIVLTIQAPNTLKFNNYVKEHAEEIVEFFTRAELNRQCDLLKEDHQPHIARQAKKMFDCDIWAPAELTSLKVGRNFMWACGERFVRGVQQTVNLVVYSYPYRDLNTFTLDYFVHKRDSVMKVNIPGPREGQYMMTTVPLVITSDETVHGKYAQVVRGLWNIKDYDMGGPFVSVSRVDEKNQRVIVAEGFVFFPNQAKRNIMKRLEAALYTLRLPDELDLERYSYSLDEIVINPED